MQAEMERTGRELPPEIDELIQALGVKLQDYGIVCYIDFYPTTPNDASDYSADVGIGHFYDPPDGTAWRASEHRQAMKDDGTV